MRRLTQWCFSAGVIAGLIALQACTRPAPPPVQTPAFDQENAYRLLVDLCAFGPRNHASDGKQKAEAWIQQRLRETGAEVTVHEFQHTSKRTNQSESFRNIIGRINPNVKERILVATHYDTHSLAEEDSDESQRSNPIIGANDGGSGVAVMLEMAMRWKENPPRAGIDLIFFDGEDFGLGEEWGDYFLGSKAWMRDHPDYRPLWGVVIDMVGDSQFEIRKERTSVAGAPAVVQRVWDAAARVRAAGITDKTGGRVMDDHTAFLEKGIPVVLLIDFNYQWFHTTADTPDKCSPDSLGQVGRTVMEAVAAQ